MTDHTHHHGGPHASEGHGSGGHSSRGHGGHPEGHAHPGHAELAETLDLDALILGSYLEEATAWAAGLAATEPRTIIDVGAGTGAGTLALARRFPNAQVTALDKSAEMLDHALKAAADSGLGSRVAGLEADLGGAWPASATADLMWASSSLHELADPERTMAEMFQALSPGGLLIVLEMDGLPRFLPAKLPAGSDVASGLEARLHAALAGIGWNQHPDWTAGLERAGFAVERRHFPTTGGTTPDVAARYARTFLGRIGPALAGTASPADLASLELLLGDGPESLERRGDLVVNGQRTAWAARKPQALPR